MLHRDVFVLHLFGGLFRVNEELVHLLGDVYLALLSARTADAGHLADDIQHLGRQIVRRNPHLHQELGNQAVFLVEQGIGQVRGFNLHILVLNG